MLKMAKDYVPLRYREPSNVAEARDFTYERAKRKPTKQGKRIDLIIPIKKASLLVGKYKDYFSQMRLNNSRKFEELVDLGQGNLVEGYHAFNNRVDRAEEHFTFLLTKLRERKQLEAYSLYILSNEKSLSMIEHRIQSRGTTHLNALERLEYVVEQYPQWREQQ